MITDAFLSYPHQVDASECIMVSADDVQRVFLQAVLSRGVLSENLAKILWARSIEVVKGNVFHHGIVSRYSRAQFSRG